MRKWLPLLSIAFLIASSYNAFTQSTSFWGIASQGGITDAVKTLGKGVIYEYNFKTHTSATHHKFEGGAYGYAPIGTLVRIGNKFYGTATNGGSGEYNGVIFEFDPLAADNKYRVVFNFGGASGTQTTAYGASPNGVILGPDETLYGVTIAGGVNSDGILYSYKPASNTFTKLYDFNESSSGKRPVYDLYLGPSKMLYGSTTAGGRNGTGTLFRYSIEGNALDVLHHFAAQSAMDDGFMSLSPVIRSSQNGKLYGMVKTGNDFNHALFELTLSDKTYRLIPPLFSESYWEGVRLAEQNEKIYLISSWNIYEFDPLADNGNGELKQKEALPYSTVGFSKGGLLSHNNKLYSSTNPHSIIPNTGWIINVDPATAGSYAGIHAFTGRENGTSFSGTFLVVEKTAHTISLPPSIIKTYGEANFQLPLTSDKGKPVSYNVTSGDGSVIQMINSNTVKIIGAGEAEITATATGDAFTETAIRTCVIKIEKAASSITFTTFPTTNKVYQDAPFTVTATVSPAVVGTPIYTSSNPGVISVQEGTNTLVINGAGNAIITATVAETSNYKGSTTTKPITVDKKSQTLNNLSSTYTKTYGDPDFAPGVTASSGQLVTYQITGSNSSNIATIVNNKVHIIGAGTVTLNASQAGDNNFAPVSGTATLQIAKANQTITFEAINPATRKYGSGKFQLNASTNATGLTVTFTTAPTGVVSISGSEATIIGIGNNIAITASQPGNANYNADTEIQYINIIKGDAVISFNSPGNKTLADGSATLTATSTSDAPIRFESSAPSIASIEGNQLVIHKTGTVVLTARQSANSKYNEATQVSHTISIDKVAQQITFNSIPTKNLRAGTFLLEASSSSSLAVTYTSSDNTIARISGNTVTLLKTGTVTITARQEGTDYYQAAADVTQSLTIVDKPSPVAGQSIPKQKAISRQPFSYTFPQESFTDPAGEPLTYSAQLKSGSALPSWLSFNSATRTFSGTPETSDQSIEIALTASDQYQQSATQNFIIEIVQNSAPVVSHNLSEQRAFQLEPFAFTFGENVFTDADGDPLTYSAQLSDGSSLPSWLSFNGTERLFSGTPSTTDKSIEILLTATDPSGASTSQTFPLKVEIITAIEPTTNLAQPNPFTDVIHIPLEGKTYKVYAYTASGVSLQPDEIATSSDGKSVKLKVTSWAPGFYIIRIKTELNETTVRMVKI